MKKVKLFEQFIAEKKALSKLDESAINETRSPKTKDELISALDDAYSKLDKYNTKYYELSTAPGGGSWSSSSKEGKAALKYKKMAGNQQANIWKWTDKLRKLGFEYNANESSVTEKREDVGEYNTVKKVVAELGRRPSEQDLASFINDNYYDVTEVERGEDDPRANDKIADLVAFYKFDIDDWEIAWEDAQNESVVNEASKDRMIKQIKRALKDGTAIFKLPMDTQNYYRKNKGDFESVVTEGKTSAVYTDPKTGKGYDLQYVSSKKRWELDIMKKGASIYSNAITTIKRNTLAEIQEWLDGYKIDSSWTKGLSESVDEKYRETRHQSTDFSKPGNNGDIYFSKREGDAVGIKRGDKLQMIYVFQKEPKFGKIQKSDKRWENMGPASEELLIKLIGREEGKIMFDFVSNLAESTVTEAVSRATKIYQIATPAPKAMLVGELEDLFGDDYRNIVTEFDDDERYESVLVFNLTPRDIKRIQEEIADVLIWEYSIKKGKEISESAMIEALSKSDRKAIAYTMAEQDPSKIKDLQNAIGQDFSDNYSSTNRSILVDVKKKGGKWVAITKETESEYNNKKPKKGEREATIGITWNAMFF